MITFLNCRDPLEIIAARMTQSPNKKGIKINTLWVIPPHTPRMLSDMYGNVLYIADLLLFIL
jgi:hypothetical protein